jgi:hypothetical protein
MVVVVHRLNRPTGLLVAEMAVAETAGGQAVGKAVAEIAGLVAVVEAVPLRGLRLVVSEKVVLVHAAQAVAVSGAEAMAQPRVHSNRAETVGSVLVGQMDLVLPLLSS